MASTGLLFGCAAQQHAAAEAAAGLGTQVKASLNGVVSTYCRFAVKLEQISGCRRCQAGRDLLRQMRLGAAGLQLIDI